MAAGQPHLSSHSVGVTFQFCAKMVGKFIWVFLLSVFSLPDTSAIGRHGNFETSDGSSCTWFPLRSGVTELTLGIACFCSTDSGVRQDYGCSFSTPINECNKDNDKYFENIIDNNLKGMAIFD